MKKSRYGQQFLSYETKTGLLVTMKIISKVLFITNMFG